MYKKIKRAPKFLKQYFWDIDFDKFNYINYPRFVIERIFEYGNEKAITWMMKNFSRTQITSVLQKSRQLTQKSANFWAFILGVKKENVKCLNRSFREIRKQFWPY
ncbi:MAG: hypothetical protein DDT31_00601 [Syntrophomonadaceae bacterium]|nr:hypothetical protein [Candidatus Psychracetigena formicireducens]MBT9138055.1 hypothetical protein [Bacillota bacterium]